MNDRILELYHEAGMNKEGVGLDAEKFAELILKDCYNILEKQRHKILSNPQDPSWTEHLADCQANIKNHFGIYF